MTRRPSTVLAGLLAVAAAMAVSAAGPMVVVQTGRAFAVKEIQIFKGEVVRFLNQDGFVHQVYVESPTMGFESDEQPPGQSIDLRFPSAGRFEVRCHIHPKMLLRVDVR